MSELGVVFYRGPSLLTGDPIVGVATGLESGSSNSKTGPMAQAWILRSDLPPMDAKRQNVDDAVCGDCKLRGRDGKDSGCYVPAWVAPHAVYKSFIAGNYPDVSWTELQALLEGRSIRLGAYGDPAAIPFEVWKSAIATVSTWIGYTHQWKICDLRFRSIVMASTDTEAETYDAWVRGWRTFRIRRPGQALMALSRRPAIGTRLMQAAEFVCPASDEAGHRTTCQRCQLCRGTSSPARSVAIEVHGKPSSLRAFGIKAPFFAPKTPDNYRVETPLLRAKFYRRGQVPA